MKKTAVFRIAILLLGFCIGAKVDVKAQTVTFNYTGSVQTYMVPTGVTLVSVDARGAMGGNTGVMRGGYGGRVMCSLTVTPGQTLNLYVGGAGGNSSGTPGASGYNNAGLTAYSYAGGGGGSSDIRMGGTALSNRVVVAGAGGGASHNYGTTDYDRGGDGGNLTGEQGWGGNSSTATSGGRGGTQSSGGAGGTYSGYGSGGSGTLGQGGNGASGTYGPSGGGGYYGGGGGSWAGGGGGSSYTHPSLCTGVSHTRGFNSTGSGVVIVTPVCTAPITGLSVVCTGSVITLSNSIGGGTWTSSAVSVATVGSAGLVSAISAGTTVISYTNSCGMTSTTVTVVPFPAAISGIVTFCAGTSSTLTNTTSGGTWVSSNTSAATVVSSTGVVTGVSAGVSVVSYSLSTSCPATKTVTVISSTPSSGIISTIAGTGTSGYTGEGGAATSARISFSYSTAVDGAGNIYFGDPSNYRIRKISTSGVITTIAGTGTNAFSGDGGAATAAQIQSPYGITVDGTGNVYFYTNYRIRKVNTSGVISTIAGTGTTGFAGDGGAATAAQFGFLYHLATDAAGNIYLPDYANRRIRKIDAFGMMTTVAGIGASGFSGDGGQATAATFSTPYGVAVDGIGNLYIADNGNSRIRKVYPSGVITTIAGTGTAGFSGDGGPATAAKINPWGVAADRMGNVFIADNANYRVRKINTSGIITTVAGNGTLGYLGDGVSATTTRINASYGVAVDATGNVIISDGGNYRIRKVSDNIVTGNLAICSGATSSLSSSLTGGSWSSSNTSVATISATGVVSGIASGTATISYSATVGCATETATAIVSVNAPPSPILGSPTFCGTGTTAFANAVIGGSWSSSNTGVATISSLGIATGISTGTTVISYTTACGLTAVVTTTVNLAPNVIAGTASVCATTTTTLTNTVSGGIWSSVTTSVATVDATTGILRGVVAGTSVVSYTIGTCAATTTASVIASPVAGTIAGASYCSIGSVITLSNAATGGFWSSSNTSVASIGSASGVLSGVSAGTSNISYTVTNICGTAVATKSVIVASGIFGYVGSVQTYTVPAGVTCVSIDSRGAQGGASNYFSGGMGARMSGIFTVIPGQVLEILVGQIGNTATNAGGGGGGTFVWDAVSDTLLVAAGGGGGGGFSGSSAGVGAPTSSNGTHGGGLTSGAGVSGNGATAPSYTYYAGGGAGWISNGNAGTVHGCGSTCQGGTRPLSGGTGGNSASSTVGAGGYGGGGGGNARCGIIGGGGGGGYSGGGAGAENGSGPYTGGGGGGSFNIGTSQSNTAGANSGHGFVQIIPVCVPRISGDTTICAGTTSTLSHPISGGTWTSSNATIATINTTGVVSGLAGGTSTISYTVPGVDSTSVVVAVYPTPAAISGISLICAGNTSTMSTTSAGGSWSSSNVALATVGTSGIVTGVSGGIVDIVYSFSSGCSSVKTMTISNQPSAIFGVAALCLSQSATLSNSEPGGAWSSSHPTLASVNASTGIVQAFSSAGNPVISYTMPGGCRATSALAVVNMASAIAGTATLCDGQTITLGHSATSGTWSSSDASVATISSGAVVFGVSSGTSMISYAVNAGCYQTKQVTVNAAPSAIAGTGTVCQGLTATLSNSVSGGTWFSNAPSKASIDITTGVVTGVSAGTALISYTIGVCRSTMPVTVSTIPGVINGVTAICAGSVTTLTSVTTGGVWSSSDVAVATTATSPGIITGVSGGTSIISYTLGGGCARTATVSVSDAPSTILGASNLCLAQIITLSNTTPGGRWSSSSTAAAIGSSTGIVTASGGTTGSTIIRYTMPGGCSTSVTISVVNMVAAISGTATLCEGQTTSLAHASAGGMWLSSDVAVATLGTGTGLVYGASPGTSMVSYVINSGCYQTKQVTVNAAPAAISGSSTLCQGLTVTLSNSVSGGTWFSNATTKATVGITNGIVTGVAAGTSLISYSIGVCRSTMLVTVSTLPGVINGVTAFCAGNVTTLTSVTTGGVWSSSDVSVATTATSPGIISGVSGGTSVISYSLGSGCARTATVSVSDAPSAIFGASNLCLAQVITLSNTTPGGRWSSSTTAAAVGSSSGIVTASGSTTGSPIIRYTMPGGCSTSVTISVVNLAAISGGAGNICEGKSTLFTNATTGGVWSSVSPAVATMGTGSGLVTGLSSGSSLISYSLNPGCARTTTVTVNAAPGISTGSTSVCQGLTITLSNPVSGGVWTSVPTSIATVGSASGIVGGVAASSVAAKIIYTMPGSCRDTFLVTVVNLAGITGLSDVCEGQTILLSNTATGGTWASGNTSVASVNATSGQVFGASAGTASITYTIGGGCMVSKTITVYAFSQISGPTTVCAGETITLSNPISGGTWSSYYTTLATVDATTGVVTGVAGSGTFNTITYTLPGGCRDTALLSVNYLAPITGSSSVCEGTSVHLSNLHAGSGGTWTSSSTSNATVTAYSADVTGLAAGTTTISYELPTGCIATHTMTINPAPGAISGANMVCVSTTITLSSTTTGGLWSCYYPSATVGSSSGVVTGVSASSLYNTITYTLPTGCRDTALVLVDGCARPGIYGGGTENLGDVLAVVPNPNAGVFTVIGQMSSNGDDILIATITNMLGQVVYSSSFETKDGRVNAPITLAKNVANGMYLLTIKTNSTTKVFHVVIEQ